MKVTETPRNSRNPFRPSAEHAKQYLKRFISFCTHDKLFQNLEMESFVFWANLKLKYIVLTQYDCKRHFNKAII